jgi:hypothetical protein
MAARGSNFPAYATNRFLLAMTVVLLLVMEEALQRSWQGVRLAESCRNIVIKDKISVLSLIADHGLQQSRAI